jgi:hypothetical protein
VIQLDVDRLPDVGMPQPLAAVRYAELGWPVLQLAEEGKVPISGHGLLDATADAAAVRRAWERMPRANIGVRVPAGYVVVDVDGPDGVEALRSRGPLPRTLTAATARGWHLWFSVPPGVELRQRAAVLPNVDSRVEGKGYVVAPPSVHATGVCYEWARRVEPAPLPAWLFALLTPAPAPAPTTYAPSSAVLDRARRSAYALAALEGEASAVATTPTGGRNHRLTAAWLRCARDLGDVLPRAIVRAELTRAALAAGLDESEIRRTLRDDLADVGRRAA